MSFIPPGAIEIRRVDGRGKRQDKELPYGELPDLANPVIHTTADQVRRFTSNKDVSMYTIGRGVIAGLIDQFGLYDLARYLLGERVSFTPVQMIPLRLMTTFLSEIIASFIMTSSSRYAFYSKAAFNAIATEVFRAMIEYVSNTSLYASHWAI